ncbi:MAG: hypothetical protein QNK37_29995 [Acidobacteriota bacterium]|nr:hypothetical protein [Acidobacteriota bacterium]
MAKKKLTLTELKVTSFPTQLSGGIEAVGIEDNQNTKHSGICTCFMDCTTLKIYSCPNGCPQDVEAVIIDDF